VPVWHTPSNAWHEIASSPNTLISNGYGPFSHFHRFGRMQQNSVAYARAPE
jgi:hypothetical protein